MMPVLVYSSLVDGALLIGSRCAKTRVGNRVLSALPNRACLPLSIYGMVKVSIRLRA